MPFSFAAAISSAQAAREAAAERELAAHEREERERELAAELAAEREAMLVEPADAPADDLEVPDIASVECELTMLRGIDALQRARSSNYTGLHMAIEEKERELAEMKARLGAEFVEPTDAEAVVEPTDAEAEDFKFKNGMALCKVFF